MSKIELPPLPEPLVHTDARINGEWRKWELYDKPQLRARDRQIVELCAALAWRSGIDHHNANGAPADPRDVGSHIAAAIRSLLNEPEGGC